MSHRDRPAVPAPPPSTIGGPSDSLLEQRHQIVLSPLGYALVVAAMQAATTRLPNCSPGESQEAFVWGFFASVYRAISPADLDATLNQLALSRLDRATLVDVLARAAQP